MGAGTSSRAGFFYDYAVDGGTDYAHGAVRTADLDGGGAVGMGVGAGGVLVCLRSGFGFDGRENGDNEINKLTHDSSS